MSQVEAVYRHGVFEPMGPVDLAEGQRVSLKIEATGKSGLKEWIEGVRTMHAEFLQQHGGPLPDSTADIAEDRMR